MPRGYTVPADSLFASGSGGAPEVWVYGRRNPWHFSFDGNLLNIADEGQNRVEEVDLVDADVQGHVKSFGLDAAGNM